MRFANILHFSFLSAAGCVTGAVLYEGLNAYLVPHAGFDGAVNCRQEDALGCYLGLVDQPNRTARGSNGCGPGGPLEPVVNPILNNYVGSAGVPCCNNHDLCYGTCGVSYDQCNQQLLSCLLVKDVPNAVAYTVYDAVSHLGCSHFQTGARNNCQCNVADVVRNSGPVFFFYPSSMLITQTASAQHDTVYLGVEVLINGEPVYIKVTQLGKRGKERISLSEYNSYIHFQAQETDTITLSVIVLNNSGNSDDVVRALLNVNCLDTVCAKKGVGSFGYYLASAAGFVASIILYPFQSLFGKCDRVTQQFDVTLSYDELLALSTPTTSTESLNGFLASPTICHDHWRYWIDYSYGVANPAAVAADPNIQRNKEVFNTTSWSRQGQS